MKRHNIDTVIKPRKIDVVIAARFELQRDGLKRTLHDNHIVNVVEVCESKKEILEAVEKNRPDVLLIEHAPYPISVLQSIKGSLEIQPDLGVLVLSGVTDLDVVQGAIEAGASGFYSKNVSIEMLRGAMLMVSRGSFQFSPEIKFTLAHPLPHLTRNAEIDAIYDKLTGREGEVLGLMAKGLPNSIISERLSITDGTVKNYVTSILSKLGADDRTQAVVLALRGEMDGV